VSRASRTGTVGSRLAHWARSCRRLLLRTTVYPVTRSPQLARALPFRTPPLLLLSYPRSGSSWIGEVIAHSPDIAYLREPVTQPFQATFPPSAPHDTLFDPAAEPEQLQKYTQFADAAFAGIPDPELFDDTFRASAFLPGARTGRRLLIKEVNPRATTWYVDRYAPTILLLVRHPAAVADSFVSAGWWGQDELEDFGTHYGRDMAFALRACKPTSLVLLRYEDFATAPHTRFAALFEQLCIRAPRELDRIIRGYSLATGDPASRYDVHRRSAEEAVKWRKRLSPGAVAEVRRGYLRAGLELYGEDADWR
jgi:hypothetical protein